VSVGGLRGGQTNFAGAGVPPLSPAQVSPSCASTARQFTRGFVIPGDDSAALSGLDCGCGQHGCCRPPPRVPPLGSLL